MRRCWQNESLHVVVDVWDRVINTKLLQFASLPKLCTSILLGMFIVFMPAQNLLAADGFTAGNSSEKQSYDIDERARLWSLIISLEDQLHGLLTLSPASVPFGDFSACDGGSPQRYLADALEKEADAIDADNGFALNGYYVTDRITNDDGRDQRGFLELSWDLLDEGVRGNNKDAHVLRSRAELERLIADQDTSRLRLRCQRDQIHRFFAPLQLDVRSLQLRLLQPIYEYERRAYFQGWSYLDELLVSERDLLLVQEELAYLEQVARDAASVNPPVIDINLSRLTEAIAEDDRFSQAKTLRDSLSKARAEAQQRQKLRLFLRQEIDDSGRLDDLVAGLRFSVPLGSRKTYALDERLRYNEASATLSTWERTAIVRSAYLEVREQLERVIKSQYALERSSERLRRSIASYRLTGNGDLPAALERLKSTLSSADELLSTKEILYRRISEMLAHSQLTFNESFIEIVAIDAPQRARPGDRALYLWSGEFEALDNDRLLDLASSKNISRFSVSAGKNLNEDKLDELLQKERRPEVELLMGDVAWLESSKSEGALHRVLRRLDQYPGLALHLDIEPQQHADYGTDRERLLDEYLAFVTRVRRAMPLDAQLRLSVPSHWPLSYYHSLAELTDELSIMAYDQNGKRAIASALQLGQVVPAHKLRWVLRSEDFPSEWVMEERIRELSRAAGLQRFGIHDATQWLVLPELTNATP